MLARQLTPQNGPGEQQPQELNLADVVSGMEAMIRLAMSPGFELRVEAKPAKAVLADRAQLEQVILNLVLNAQEKTGGSRQLAIRTYPMTVDEAYAREHPALRPGVYSVLEVSETLSDSGDGLDATTPPSNPERGAVPDIAGVAAAVRHFGGYIWVTSELGRGTMFRIFLPQA
jgi:signal transduction histidine kinase